MCQINNVLHNTEDKPITCYKVLLRDLKENIRSPYFFQCLWKLGETKRLRPLWIYKEKGWIGPRFFHTFIDKADAYREQRNLIEIDSRYSYIIAEMEIPPHTDYYTGITSNGFNGIATQVITFKQIL